MQAFDASSIVYAWDNYPKEQFPSLWTWLADLVGDHEIFIPDVALLEVVHVAPDCAEWLKSIPIQQLTTTSEVLNRANEIKAELGISNDQFHPEGVDENDLIIIAAAEVAGATLVSDEAVQNTRPTNQAKYKIPAVCNLPSVGVECRNFLDFIKLSERIFG